MPENVFVKAHDCFGDEPTIPAGCDVKLRVVALDDVCPYLGLVVILKGAMAASPGRSLAQCGLTFSPTYC